MRVVNGRLKPVVRTMVQAVEPSSRALGPAAAVPYQFGV